MLQLTIQKPQVDRELARFDNELTDAVTAAFFAAEPVFLEIVKEAALEVRAALPQTFRELAYYEDIVGAHLVESALHALADVHGVRDLELGDYAAQFGTDTGDDSPARALVAVQVGTAELPAVDVLKKVEVAITPRLPRLVNALADALTRLTQ